MKKATLFILMLAFAVLPLLDITVVSDEDNDCFESLLSLPSNTKPEDSILEETVGMQRYFWVFNWETLQYEQMLSTMLAKGQHCYIYMTNQTIEIFGENSTIENCQLYANEFDRIIYPANFELMGNPDGVLGDVDGDPRITVLFENVGSYYSTVNEETQMYSNAREMVYVGYVNDYSQVLPHLCHETNHLFMFNYDLNEPLFFYEGLAEFSLYYAGYLNNETFLYGDMRFNHTQTATVFADYPDASLFFFEDSFLSEASYGASFMFILYLAEQYGVEILKELVAYENDGPLAIEEILSQHDYYISFNELFLNFITACTLDLTETADDLYGFKTTQFRLSKRKLVSGFPFSYLNVKHRYYGVNIIDIESPPDVLTLKFSTPAEPRSLGISIALCDDAGWNITKKILTENGDNITFMIEGNNITQIYIITTMIREGISTAPTSYGESPIVEINFRVLEGKIFPTTESSVNLLFTFILLIFTHYVFNIKCKRKQKYS